MTTEEFNMRLKPCTRRPTEKEFEVITFVYDYHPAIGLSNAKDRIARLYEDYGMRVIYDMLPTAKRAKAYTEEIIAHQKQIDELREEMDDLRHPAM